MGVKELTDLEIKNAKPRDKSYTLYDGGNLHLLVKPNGSKLWEIYYKSPTKKKRRKTSIGTYPKKTLVSARKTRDKYMTLVTEGIDPIDYFKKQKETKEDSYITQNVFKEWLSLRKREVENGFITKKTFQRMESLLINDCLPFIKDLRIQDVTKKDITNVIDNKNKTAPESAKRLLQYLNKLWIYATSKDYCEYNLIASIDKTSHITRRRVSHYAKIIDINILKELVNAIYDYSGHVSTKNALKFVLHVPLRAKNLVNLQWKQIDFEKRILTIPRSEMKVSDQDLPDFIMPLTDEVIKILNEQKQYTGHRKFVFASDTGSHINIETTNRALQRLGFNDEKRGRKQRTHSFRGTFRALADTYQKEHNATYEAKERALDHQVGGAVERAYTGGADYINQLKILMNWWSNFITNLLD